MTLTAQSDATIEYLDVVAAELVEVEGDCAWCGDAAPPGERFCDEYCRRAAWRGEHER